MHTNHIVSRLVHSLITITALLSSQLVFSQSALEEIIVTAQKREQSLQNVPISVATLSGDDMMIAGVRNLEEMAVNVPGLFLNESRNSALIYLRGIGTSQQQNSFEQSVSMFVDGVYIARPRGVKNLMMDVERVEILRGPQTTFFGQNTIAGGISMITKGPTEEWTGYLNTSYEAGFGETNVDLAYGGPLTDTLGIRFAGRFSDFDGFGTDLTTAEGLGKRESLGYRVTAEWQPTDAWTITGKFNHANTEGDGGYMTEIVGCTVAPASPCHNALVTGLNAEYAYDQVVANGGVQGTDVGVWPAMRGPFPFGGVDLSGRPDLFGTEGNSGDTYGSDIKIEYTLENGITFTSITAYRDDLHRAKIDVDHTPITYVSAVVEDLYDQTSQEFRITSPGGEVIDWLAGVYYQAAENTLQVHQFIGFMGGIQMGIYYHEESEWLAAFAGATWHASDELSLDLGLRYTTVDKSGIRQTQIGGMIDPTAIGTVNPLVFVNSDCIGIDGFVTKPCAYGDFNDSDLSYSIGVNWEVPDTDTMLYAKYSTGFKSGGLTSGGSELLNESYFEYDSEQATAYEIGAKSTWLDGRLELNAALFRTEIADAQVSTLDTEGAATFTPLSVTGNAGELISQGLELDGRFAASDNLTLSYSILYLDAFYDEYTTADCNPAEIADGRCDPVLGIISRSGEAIEFSTDFEANIGATYRVPMTIVDGFNLDFSGNLYHNNGYNPSVVYDTRLVQDAYQRINLRATLAPIGGKWSVSIFGDNITDEIVLSEARQSTQNGDDALDVITSKGGGYGVQFRYNFGAF